MDPRLRADIGAHVRLPPYLLAPNSTAASRAKGRGVSCTPLSWLAIFSDFHMECRCSTPIDEDDIENLPPPGNNNTNNKGVRQ